MSKFGDLVKGNIPVSAPEVKAAPAPEPSKKEEPVLEKMDKKELEKYGRTKGIELDRRHSKDSLIKELKDVEGE